MSIKYSPSDSEAFHSHHYKECVLVWFMYRLETEMVTYLANENRQTGYGRMFSLDCGDVLVYVVLECLDVLGGVSVGALEVVVDVDEVKGAACAGFYESLKVCEAGGAAAICYGWSAELYFTVIGLQVFLVNGDGVGDGEVGLAGIVGLVGSE